MIIFLHTGQEIIISNWHWITIQTLKLTLSFKIDYFSIIFVPVALFITWAIIEFSIWYIHLDPYFNQFFKYLLLFLITILIFVTANNLFQLFTGWEGVGIISFLLIGWWYGWTDASTAALQAILYNCIGVIRFIISIAWFLSNSNAWDLQQSFILNLLFKPPPYRTCISRRRKISSIWTSPLTPLSNRMSHDRISPTPLKHNSRSRGLPTYLILPPNRKQ